ncbi:TetR/AcrR family transcriptional regulator [Vallicoccus soli]|uniref:TetR/AcrR family transcriptional regulator n=1 Tax=Vallicoccus soli TaxID=2339232 RepID=A0A3A3ZJQ2_9ACTN|nr:TetR/AcrR family transcriptional regulator [Vallicoccus soli]RJK95953.1 TetR/AcrR family transcriptional regulator [Vallicoccus soli]
MGRWEPGAPQRLQRAALELFTEQGFDATTVAGIAERAGVTERTFFRHYADKREVLFAGEDEFREPFLRAVTEGPAGAPALDLVRGALAAACAAFEAGRSRDHARARQRVVDAHPPLRERELLKLAGLAAAVGDALVARGVPPLRARLGGELAVSVFAAAFALWTAPGEERDLVRLQAEAMAEVLALVDRPGELPGQVPGQVPG